MLQPIPEGLSIVHKPSSDSYAYWGGPEAVRRAHARGATAIDIDGWGSATGTAVCVHWHKWWAYGWTAPASVPRKIVQLLTDQQIAQISVKSGAAKGYQIHTLRSTMETAAPLGVTICWEIKNDSRFEQHAAWEPVVADAEETGARVVIMTIEGYGNWRKRLQAAYDVGLPTLLLTRDNAVTASDAKFLTYAKGNANQIAEAAKLRNSRGELVRTLGLSAANATKWGASTGSGATTIAATNTAIRKAGGKWTVPVLTKPKPEEPTMPKPPTPRPTYPKGWRGTQIEAARTALKKATRPSVQAQVNQALSILDKIPPLGD